jgi:hypothetical protein
MFQEQSFSTELCVNDREHRLTERGHKNGMPPIVSLLLPLLTKMLAKASIASAYTVIVAISLISRMSVSPASS